MLQGFHATPGLTVWVVFGPLFAAFGVFLCATMYLSGALDYVRKERSYLSDFLPERNASRAGAMAFYLWIWTRAHRELADTSITRTIYLVRASLALTVLIFVLLWRLPPDYAERLAATLNRHGF
jgi:hypothetical protein